ncbi:MAG: C40 family peptidase [Lachnospiraceae bacterium]|nr:C40 family peptidase [Lachnospiraceae bacterium]
MFKSAIKKISYLFMATGAMILLMGYTVAHADVINGETSLCGASFVIDSFYDNADDIITEDEDTFVSTLLSNDMSLPDNAAFAKVDAFLNIRKAATTDSDIIGYLPRNGVCYIISDPEYGFVRISSGEVEGYVATDYLYTGISARSKVEEIAPVKATVNTGAVNLRKAPSLESEIVTTLSKNESLNVDKNNQVVLGNDKSEWVTVIYKDQPAYILKKYVNVGRNLVYACTVEEVIGDIGIKNVTALRAAIITEAKKHLGLKYVWGGLSLSKGADCSGFCCAVFAKCGFDLLDIGRSSYTLAGSSYGRKVTYEEAKPGDLVFYKLKKGRVSHVAIYLGGGKIIHESSNSGCAVISDIDCMKVAMIKNFID